VKNTKLIVSLVVLAVLAGFGVWAYYHVPFSFSNFRSQLLLADWSKIAIAVGCIYLGYIFRGVRWAMLVRQNKRVPLLSLVGTQVIGFTAVAIVGRVADLVRPYLVSKKTGLPLSTQIAVYIVERLFDAGSMALIFSSTILFAPAGALPHPEIFRKVGYWGLAGTLAGALFLVAVRVAGEVVANFLARIFGMFSKGLGSAIADKIRSFRTGLDTLRTPLDLAITLVVSLVMWGLITAAYLETAQAFVASPELKSMTLAKGMVLMVVSGGASVLQLPVLGWFTQIGVVAAAMSSFFAVKPEPSAACAATLLLVTFLSIVPVGLIWAQFTHVSLRKVAEESEHAAERTEARPGDAAAVEEPSQA
jgi:glycosyltransferase 2 family protein